MNKLTQFKSTDQYVVPKINLHAMEVEGLLCESYSYYYGGGGAYGEDDVNDNGEY